MKIILVYLVTHHHLRNFYLLKKIYKNYKFVILYENNLTNFQNNDLINKYLNFNIEDLELTLYLKKNRDKIYFSFFSTLQIRKSVLCLYENIIINNIPIFTIQETHQMFLHNENQNNYILPSDILFVCSNYEKEIFEKYNYKSNLMEVSGWPHNLSKSKKLNRNDIKYCLLILNASKEVNPISIETKKIQNKIIKILSNKIPKEYKLYIKQHPSDVREKLYLPHKNVILLNNEIEIKSLIEEANIIITTGYTQAIFEAILLEKDINIIKMNEKNQIILHLKDDNIINLKDDNIIFSKEYIQNNYLQIKEINNLNKSYDQICLTLEKKISNFFNIKNNNIHNYEKSLSLIIWLIYLNEIKSIKSYLSIISKESFFHNLEFIYKALVEKNFNEDLLINFLKEHKQTNLFYPIKYIILKKMLKYNINLSILKNNFVEYFFVKDFKYLRSIFYNDLQFILFKISIQKNNFYFNLEKLDTEHNKDLLDSKNKYLRFLILLRKKNFLFKTLFFKIFLFFFNFDNRLQ